VRHAENAVHRRPDLVAHRSQETRLRPACGLRLIAGVRKGGLNAALLGHIAAEKLDLAHAAVVKRNRVLLEREPA
jgi:hypothetical protein